MTHTWDESFLFNQGLDHMVRRCIHEHEASKVFESCHFLPYDGHHGGKITAHKVLQFGFLRRTLFNDVFIFVEGRYQCQSMAPFLQGMRCH